MANFTAAPPGQPGIILGFSLTPEGVVFSFLFFSTAAPVNADGEESAAAVTSKQRELLNACNLHLRVLDPAFLDAVGQDRKLVLIRALEVDTAMCIDLYIVRCQCCHACYTSSLLHTSIVRKLPSRFWPCLLLQNSASS